MKTDTYNKSTVWFLSTPIQSWHFVRPPLGVVFFCDSIIDEQAVNKLKSVTMYGFTAYLPVVPPNTPELAPIVGFTVYPPTKHAWNCADRRFYRISPFLSRQSPQIAPLTDTVSVYLPKKTKMWLVADIGSVIRWKWRRLTLFLYK